MKTVSFIVKNIFMIGLFGITISMSLYSIDSMPLESVDSINQEHKKKLFFIQQLEKAINKNMKAKPIDINAIANLLDINKQYINTILPGNYIPLHRAVISKAPKIVELLVKHGADINFVDSNHGSTALHYAVKYSNPSIEIINFLLNNGACTNAIDMIHGYTPLHYAVEWGNIQTITLLLNYKAPINISSAPNNKYPYGVTPLELAKKLFEENQNILNATTDNATSDLDTPINFQNPYQAIIDLINLIQIQRAKALYMKKPLYQTTTSCRC